MKLVLIPGARSTSAQVEYADDGRYALIGIRDLDGALVVSDAATLGGAAPVDEKSFGQ